MGEAMKSTTNLKQVKDLMDKSHSKKIKLYVLKLFPICVYKVCAFHKVSLYEWICAYIDPLTTYHLHGEQCLFSGVH